MNKHLFTPVTAAQIVKRFPDLFKVTTGDLSTAISQPSSQENAAPNSIVFVSVFDTAKALLTSPVAVLVVSEKIAAQVQELKPSKPILVTKDPYFAMAIINKEFFSLTFLKKPIEQTGIHPTAVIAKTAKIASTATIGPNVLIGEGCVIGERTYIGANSVVEPYTTLGEDCYIHPLVYIGHTNKIGNRVEIMPNSTIGSDGYGYAHDQKGNHYRIPHYGSVILEDDVHLGGNVNVDRGTFDSVTIGAGTKIDNHVHIAHNNNIGKNCLITAGFISAGSTDIGDNCVFAGRCSTNGHIKIGSNMTFGPFSAIVGNMDKPGIYAGYPPTPFAEQKRILVSLPKVPALRKKVARILKHLGLEDTEE